MNPRENALRIIRFDAPERVVTAPPCTGLAYLGANHEGYGGGGHHLPVGSRWTDIWGVEWHREQDGVMGFPRGNPLADFPAALRTYRWPDPDDERLLAPLARQAEACDGEKTFLCGSHRDTLWEKSYMLAGMETMMVAFHTEPNAAREVLRRIMDFHLGIAEHYAELGVEIVSLSDDLGTQQGLLLSPQIIDEFLMPEYRRLIGFYKRRGVTVNFHSCGHVEPLIGRFLELGIDILNPIQASANDLDAVRRATQGRIALQGGVSSALVVSGPAEAIREEVRRRILQLGRDGGYFCRPDQGMPWPREHLRALEDAVAEFGTYPLTTSDAV